MSGVQDRAKDHLRRLSRSFIQELEHPDTVEIMVNPDGQIWLEQLGNGMTAIGTLDVEKVQAIIQIVAGHHRVEVHSKRPILEEQWPLDKSRFSAELPPIVSAPAFSIRRRAAKIFSLSNYVEAGIMSTEQSSLLTDAMREGKNILVAGGTGSGKTTLLNGMIAEMVRISPELRFVLIEDLPELQCSAKNSLELTTTSEISMTDLLKHSLRVRPDRILVGEVRGMEALDLAMAWNTGHSGGLATIHSDPGQALQRLELLMGLHPHCPKNVERYIGQAVDLIVYITKTSNGTRRVHQISQCRGYDGEYLLSKIDNL